MRNLTLTYRLKTYVLYSVVGLLLTIILSPISGMDGIFILHPIIFNVAIFLKFDSE